MKQLYYKIMIWFRLMKLGQRKTDKKGRKLMLVQMSTSKEKDAMVYRGEYKNGKK